MEKVLMIIDYHIDSNAFVYIYIDRHTLVNKHNHSIFVVHVQEAIHNLKSIKSDCKDQLFSDHFINGTDRFLTLTSLLFTCMLTHGVVFSGLILSPMIPVPKKKRASISDSNN